MGAVSVRGIYSAALTKLLVDHSFGRVQASADVESNLRLVESPKKYDLDIFDRRDRQGVLGLGAYWAVQELRVLLLENLLDVVVRNPRSVVGSVYRLSLDFEFPGYSKSRLDEIRGSVTPTIRGHHLYKACGDNLSSAVDRAESLLTDRVPRDQVESLFAKTIASGLPFEGSLVEIEHVKLNGDQLSLGTAAIERFDKDKDLLTLRRRLRGKGVYDGLKMQKKPGDYAITDAKLGEWFLVTRYFSRRGDLKGTYVNLNTPIELYPDRLRYVDMEVDICIWPDGRISVLDTPFLADAVKENLVSRNLHHFIEQKTRELTKNFVRRPPTAHELVM